MKIIWRTLVILAVFAAVSDLIYLIFNNASNSISASGGERPSFEQSGNFPDGGGRHEGGRGGHEEGGASAGGLLINFIKIAGVSLIVMAINLFLNLIGKKKAQPTITV